MRCSLVSGRFISFVKTGEKGKTQVIKRKRFFLKATKAFDEQCVPTGINLMNKLRENPLLKKITFSHVEIFFKKLNQMK